MILTIGNSSSYELAAFSAVVESLQRRGYQAVLFKQDKCLEDEFLTFKTSRESWKFEIKIDGRRYSAEDFSAIWYLKPHLPRRLLEHPIVDYRQFIRSQFFTMRQAMWNLFHEKRWINDPWAQEMAENKIYQLRTAIEVGLHIPDTIITSDPDEVRIFYKNHSKGIVTKMLKTSPLLDSVIYTNLVTKEAMERIDSVKMAPCIFQSVVQKQYELRITIVGDHIFPAKVYSQGDPETSLDWRKKPKLNDFEVKMEITSLPEAITEKLKLLMARLGLRYGCIDMVVTPEGEHIFLEINPNGQWYFVQLRTEASIAEAIADLLVS